VFWSCPGKERATLALIEDEFGVVISFLCRELPVNPDAGNDTLAIFGPMRARKSAEFEVILQSVMYSKYRIIFSDETSWSLLRTAMIAVRISGFDCLQQLLLYAMPLCEPKTTQNIS
jgi:hypothetical protein